MGGYWIRVTGDQSSSESSWLDLKLKCMLACIYRIVSYFRYMNPSTAVINYYSTNFPSSLLMGVPVYSTNY